MRTAIVTLAVAWGGLASGADAPGDFGAACLARLEAAKAELIKVNPIFAKATVKLDSGDTPTFRLEKRRHTEEWEAGVRPVWGRRRVPWYDPGCGDGCPVLIAERETLSRDGWYYIQVTEQDERTQQAYAAAMHKAVDDCIAISDGGAGFGPGFWKSLVKAGARWELTSPLGDGTVVVETRDVRQLAGADVARLRWTFTGKDGKSREVGDSGAGRYTQLAVTPAGLYLLDADQDDASVTAALARKPARSDPPRPYGPSAQNQGRFLELVRAPHGAVACMGMGPVVDDPKATVSDFGVLCVAAEAGIVRIDGKWSPTGDLFLSKAFER